MGEHGDVTDYEAELVAVVEDDAAAAELDDEFVGCGVYVLGGLCCSGCATVNCVAHFIN